MLAIVVIVIFAVMLAIGAPMGVALAGIGIMPNFLDPTVPYNIDSALRSLTGGLDSFLLLAIPLFMLSGVIMARGGISEKLFNIFSYFCGNATAGFPAAVIITCLFYGAISGSGPATTAAVGAMTIPFMVARGYDKIFATSLVAVAGGLGVIIPPSIPMIAYSTISGASVANLFVAGILPGILVAAFLMLYSYYFCKTKGEDKEKLAAHYKLIRSKGLWGVFKDGFWALLAPIIILGSIYSGTATPTEAASISVYYALIVSLFIYKSLKLSDLIEVLRETVKTYASLLFVIGCAVILSRVLTLLQISRVVEQAVLSNVSSKIVVLLMINLIMLLAGMIMDAVPALMIFTPILLPIAVGVGVNPIHLGIIMTVNLAIGFVTPPVGINLYVSSNMTGIPVLRIAKSATPFIIAFMISLLLITFVPIISLALV